VTNQLASLFSSVLNVDASKITDETSPANTETWDSLANMLLIAAIEETFEIELSTPEIEAMKSFGDVRSILESRDVSVKA